MTFVSKYCDGEKCRLCGHEAQHKVEEVIFDDDPHQKRHPYTAYICHNHFRIVMGQAVDRFTEKP